MNLKELSYLVGVRSRFVPFYRRYRVVGHRNEQIGDKVRLVLRCVDGSMVCVPDVGKKLIKIYPEFDAAEQAQLRLKQSQGVPDGVPSEGGE